MADAAPLHHVRRDPAHVVSVYYGAGDSVVGLATVRLDELLACVRRAPASRLPGLSAIVDGR